MTATTATKARTTRKIVGSLAIIGAAAAVAGLGTFGTFTDSTTPLNASVVTGTLSLDLNAVGSSSINVNVANMVAGDKITRAFDLANTGELNFSGITVQSVDTNTTKSILSTDKVNGLQLGMKSCSVAYTERVTNGVPTYTCSGTETTLISDALSSGAQVSQTLTGAASLVAHKTDHLAVSLLLPANADNTFQGKSAAMSVSFTGTQADGTAR